MAIVALSVWPGTIATRLAPILIGLGYLCYPVGVIFIVQGDRRWVGWRLANDWHNTNCVMHGALSISGLAALASDRVPGPIISVTWVGAAMMFVCVEGIELARLRARIRDYGWRRGIATYDVTQRARTFTFGMFYAFTLTLHHRAVGVQLAPLLADLQQAVVKAGPYGVLFLLAIECLLLMKEGITARVSSRSVARTA